MITRSIAFAPPRTAAATLPPRVTTANPEADAFDFAFDKTAQARVTQTAFWQSADAGTRQQFLSVARATSGGKNAAVMLADLAENGALAERATDGRTLLQILATSPKAVAGRKAMGNAPLSYEILAEVARPQIITQAGTNACTMTSIAIALATHEPAEYARLVSSLATAGKVTLRGGKTLALDTNSAEPYQSDPRTGPQRMLESSLMQFSQPELDYASNGFDPPCFIGPRIFNTLPLWKKILACVFFPAGVILFLSRKEDDGLNDANWCGTLDCVFGRKFAIGAPHREPACAFLEKKLATGPALARVGWNGPVKMAHLMVVDHVEGNRVIFRDPNGPYSPRVRKGDEIVPGFIVVDPTRGWLSADPNAPEFRVAFVTLP